MIYKNVVSSIRGLINHQDFRVGDCLPSEVRLADRFGVSRMTVRKALDVLIKDGLLERQQGRGTFIIGKDLKHDNNQLNSFTEHMKMLGKTPHTEVTAFEVTRAPQAIARQLDIETQEKIYYIKRLRYANKQIIQIEESYLPVALLPDLTYRHLESSKYDFIEKQANFTIEGCRQTFLPIVAGQVFAEQLHCDPRTLLLQLLAVSNTREGVIVDFSVITFNPNDYKISYYLKRHPLD
ncbi:GntR family transcriptional regulator [Biostraticola tofi]|uniref:GntR family transcriptional regulator n=1 Tax=Biostraticola tofi TaxID=466109 RepID=A0A4R3YW02_9GAMM|nr:GntR family transcriptional regulator [Biostraticola tofi]TCV96770.1 GntR family transcriptional regulator [Biostraticola tofi]